MRFWFGALTLIGCASGTLDIDSDDTDTDLDTDTDTDTDPIPLPPLNERLLSPLNALQTIADNNEGHRSVGSSGYDASVDYVSDTLESFGLEPERHPFSLSYYNPKGATLEVPDLTLTEDEDYTLMWYSPGGDVTAPLHAVDIVIPPGEDPNTSTSACENDDFKDFPEGHIALIQRGSCFYEQKVQNAISNGAAGVIIFNEGQPGRQDLIGGTLDSEHSGRIPVVFTTYAVGEALAEVKEPVRLFVDAETVTLNQDNITATRQGNSGKRWVLGAHLDSVFQGPGINDNGTGVAVILEIGRYISSIDPNDSVTVSFWGAEEVGLVGLCTLLICTHLSSTIMSLTVALIEKQFLTGL